MGGALRLLHHAPLITPLGRVSQGWGGVLVAVGVLLGVGLLVCLVCLVCLVRLVLLDVNGLGVLVVLVNGLGLGELVVGAGHLAWGLLLQVP